MELLTPASGLSLWGLILGTYLSLYLISVWLVWKERSLSPLLKVALSIVLFVTPFIGPVLYIALSCVVSMLHKSASR